MKNAKKREKCEKCEKTRGRVLHTHPRVSSEQFLIFPWTLEENLKCFHTSPQRRKRVSDLAKYFALPFNAEAHAARIGLLHDAGKYSDAGQRRMNDPEDTAKVDHSTAGAKISLEIYNDAYSASAIIGHHGGMPDLGSK
ncbi:MAG: HD domain-containing protein [Clostridia bacterium]|nr:HD domain-containing protein [Clostridia bacterium]MBR4360786.1 HD domain-containing protein [Clostridia bacterium]